MSGPTRKVQESIEAGWSATCDGLAAVAWFRLDTADAPRHALKVRAGGREVEVYISPTGRSVRVWVDHEEVRRG